MDQLKSYVANNLLSVMWSFLLAVGGVGLLIHFWVIDYFPNDIELETATALLLAVAATALLFMLLMAAFLALPGIIYLGFHDATSKEIGSGDTEFRKVVLLVGGPILLATALVGASLIPNLNLKWQVPLWVGLIVIFVGWCLSIFPKNINGSSSLKTFGLDFLRSTIVGLGALLPLFVIFLMMAEYEKTQADQFQLWTVFFWVVLITAISNVLIVIFHKKWKVAISIVLVVLIFIMLVTQQLKIIPEASVRLLKLGDVRNASLVLDQQGCEIACRLGVLGKQSLSILPLFEATKDGKVNDKPTAVCQLQNVKILSRIGREYYLEARPVQGLCNKGATQSEVVRFAIPELRVLAWSVPIPASGVAVSKGEH